MNRYLYLTFALLSNFPMCAKEPLVLYLERDESVAHMVANGNTLAIAFGYRTTWDPSKGPALPKENAAVALIREGEPPLRTPLKPGAMRAIVATPSGFVAAQVKYDTDGKSTAEFFEVDLVGRVTAILPLEINLVGLWVSSQGELFAYGPRAVFSWSTANPVWVTVPLHLAANADAIRKIVTLKNGSSLVVTDRLIKGFRNLQESPVFVKDLKTYPNPIKAFGDDRWWIIISDGHTQRIVILSEDGQDREVASLRAVNPHSLLFGGEKVFVVCAREGGNIHKYSYYVLDRDGSGSLRGPFMLPDDTISTCIWDGSIVSGGATNRVYKTVFER